MLKFESRVVPQCSERLDAYLKGSLEYQISQLARCEVLWSHRRLPAGILEIVGDDVLEIRDELKREIEEWRVRTLRITCERVRDQFEDPQTIEQQRFVEWATDILKTL